MKHLHLFILCLLAMSCHQQNRFRPQAEFFEEATPPNKDPFGPETSQTSTTSFWNFKKAAITVSSFLGIGTILAGIGFFAKKEDPKKNKDKDSNNDNIHKSNPEKGEHAKYTDERNKKIEEEQKKYDEEEKNRKIRDEIEKNRHDQEAQTREENRKKELEKQAQSDAIEQKTKEILKNPIPWMQDKNNNLLETYRFLKQPNAQPQTVIQYFLVTHCKDLVKFNNQEKEVFRKQFESILAAHPNLPDLVIDNNTGETARTFVGKNHTNHDAYRSIQALFDETKKNE